MGYKETTNSFSNATYSCNEMFLRLLMDYQQRTNGWMTGQSGLRPWITGNVLFPMESHKINL